MNRRSLLDYFPDNGAADETPSGEPADPVSVLERRLAELEGRLNAARQSEDDGETDRFSSQIEAILKRRTPEPGEVRDASQPAPDAARVEMKAPPLAPELSAPHADRSAEFTKFVEAVHLIGQAATRFLHSSEPRRASLREAPEPIDRDAIRLTLALKEAVGAFQAMTADLANAASELRLASSGTPRPDVKPDPTPRTTAREDAELVRLQEDLEDLRARLGAIAGRRSRDGY